MSFSGHPRILAPIVKSLRIAFIEIHSFLHTRVKETNFGSPTTFLYLIDTCSVHDLSLSSLASYPGYGNSSISVVCNQESFFGSRVLCVFLWSAIKTLPSARSFFLPIFTQKFSKFIIRANETRFGKIDSEYCQMSEIRKPKFY